MLITVEVPISTISGANAREHWGTRAKRVKRERKAVATIVSTLHPRGVLRQMVPCAVTLIRRSPRLLDTGDNLPSALKAVRDEVAKHLGVDDRDPRVQWKYDQAKGPKAVIVEIKWLGACGGCDDPTCHYCAGAIR